MLAGVPGGPSDWTRAGSADRTADAFAAGHGGRAPILVMADPMGSFTGDTECVDSTRFGRAEDYLLTDVPAFVRQRFGASAAPGSLAVAGLSAGGYCALMLSLRHGDVFPTFADYSGTSQPTLDAPGDALRDLFDGDRQAFDAHDPTVLLRTNRYPGLAGWFEVGEQDEQFRADVHRVAEEALRSGMATCVRTRPGGHDFAFWADAFRDSLPWLSARLGLTPVPPEAADVCAPAGA